MEIIGIVDAVFIGGEGAVDAEEEGVEGGEERSDVGDEGLEGDDLVSGLRGAGAEEAVVGADEADGSDGVGEGEEGVTDETAAGEVAGVGEATEDVDEEGRGEIVHGG